MAPTMSVARDPFEAFAERSGLRMRAESVYSAPRDVLHPPADSDQAFLVTLNRESRPDDSLSFVYFLPMTEEKLPGVRDVLWWLAADGWAIDKAENDLAAWATGYGYAIDDPATARLFSIHRRQQAALRKLLGDGQHAELLGLYCSEVSSQPARRSRS